MRLLSVLQCKLRPYLQRIYSTKSTTFANRRKMLKPTDVFDTISEEEAVKEAQRAQRAAAARAAMQAATSSEDAKMASLCSSLNAEYGAKVSVDFLRMSKWP